ncbi:MULTISPECIES: ParB/RepB/Spo0J family partition protein [unclassified Micromonospora]|uniref:ParB/RepB/Spo0J family partition protein n=1 Tax=unclassified Micromonospora TaxID=2617518 RepID=UPI001C229B8F|nr:MULTISPECIES: ParB/RepB/Spo0J family partition protein [unclassified Micromonospora]MBU8857959.1 ParB/RepB/Spo0J family partition protein [Micromonospora sp. WMMB482]MDM4783590.1 ParB/RepB/Spo0J family partition protein [Micromonospora sp. b486]
MKNRPRGGLGRGLGALIPTGPVPGAEPAAVEPEASAAAASPSAPVAGATAAITGGLGSTPPPAVEPEPQLSPVPGARFAEIPVDAIVPNPKQPRHVFDEEALEELKTSIQEVGFLQPIVVRQLDPEKFELVMGERRWRAAQAVGRETIPAIVRDTKDDAMLRDALLENIHRANLNPLEEAAAYQQLLEEFGATHEELARRIGRSRPQISNTIRLMNLPPAVQRRVAAGVLSAGHARALLSLDNAEAQEALAERIVREGITVRGAEELVHLALAEEPAKSAAAKRRPKPHAPALTDLADRLSDRFDTRVKVDIGRSKGKITIEFATVDDLERIVGIIGMGEDGQPDA